MKKNTIRKNWKRKKKRPNSALEFYVSKNEIARLKAPFENKNNEISLASLEDRFISTAVDFLPLIVGALLEMFFPRFEKIILGVFAVVVYIFGILDSFLLTNRGQTIGKFLKRIRIAKFENGESVKQKGILLREAPFIMLYVFSIIAILNGELIYVVFSLLVILLDVLFVFRKDRRCIHDLLAGTKVVNVSKPVSLEEAIRNEI